MQGVLLAAGVTVLLVVLALAGSVALVVRSLRRRNRVSPRLATTAPLDWLWSPRPGARLHRRLARTVAAARGCVAGGSAGGLHLADLVAELEAHACAVDAQLVVVDRAPQPARGRLLRELQSEAAELESLAERVIRMNRAWSGAVPSARGLTAVRNRVDALEEALGDLERIDRLPQAPARPERAR